MPFTTSITAASFGLNVKPILFVHLLSTFKRVSVMFLQFVRTVFLAQ